MTERGRPRAADDGRAPRARVHAGARGLQLRERAAEDRDALLVLLRQLSRAGQVAPLRRSGRGGARRRRTRALLDGAVGAAAAVRALPAVRDRRSVVVVAARIGPRRAPGRTPTELFDACRRRRRRRRAHAWSSPRPCSARSARRRAKSSGRSRPPVARARSSRLPDADRALLARGRSRPPRLGADPGTRRRIRPTRSRSMVELAPPEPPQEQHAHENRPVPAAGSGALSRGRPAGARRGSRLGRRHHRSHRARRICARAASSSPSARCVIAGPRRRRRGVPAARPGLRVRSQAATTAIAAQPGDVVAEVRGQAAAMLTAERTALNFLQRLSGIATLTRQFVDADRRRHHRPRHAQDDADAARAREVRRPRRRRHQPPRAAWTTAS